MMFPTNNKFVINKLTNRTMRANKLRNTVVISAIVITTFLITTIFSIGMSLLDSFQLQKLRTMGTDAHVALTLPTVSQVEKLKSLDYIKIVGLQAYAGSVENTPKMGNMVLDLHWFDNSEWEDLRKPAMSDFFGTYPKEHNEIMIATWILNRMGISEPKLGMEIAINYHVIAGKDKSTTKKQTFKLTGYYTEYMNLRSDNIGSMLVSKAFLEGEGMSPELSGEASVRFKANKNIYGQVNRIIKDLKISDIKNIKIVPIYNTTTVQDASNKIALSALLLFIMVSSYLLIYNVLYLSITKDIRFFGLLKTIGTTPKQIKRIVIGQALRMSYLGISIGLILGAIASFIVVPLVLSITNLETAVKLSFSPIIYIGAALFSLITTLISSLKPARKASSISPIEAIRFTSNSVRVGQKSSTSGGKIHKMAIRNIFRDKKRAFVVFVSLFLGITIFLTINTLLLSMDIDNLVSSYMENDIKLTNNTMQSFSSEEKQKFDDSFITKVESLQGISNLRKVVKEDIVIKFDEQLYDKHIRAYSEKHKITIPTNEEIRQYPEIFISNLIGLDTEYIKELNKQLDTPIDIAAFDKGEIALIATNNPENYKLGSVITFNQNKKDEQTTIKLGGFLPEITSYGSGIAPNIFISNNKMKQLVSDPKIFAISLDIQDKYDEQVLLQLKQIVGEDNEITLDSRLEMLKKFSDAKTIMNILGGGMSLVLALIGIMNFVNIMVTSVNSRRQELAVIESIGMTRKQLKKMLVFEGLTYAVISYGLVATLGNAITYGLFLLFKTEATYAIFTFPTIPLTLSFIMILTVCIYVPIFSYKSISKQTITERLRSIEG